MNTLTFQSHQEILALWKNIPTERAGGSFLRIIALDMERFMGGRRVTYHRVLRWYQRNAVPIEYHHALVKAASRRGFRGVTTQVLAGIKAREYIQRGEAAA